MKTKNKPYNTSRVITSLLAIAILAAGCAAPAPQPQAPAPAEPAAPVAAPPVQEDQATIPSAQAGGVPATESGTVPAPDPAPAAKQPAATESTIGLDAAKTIALEHAKLAAADVTFTKTKEDRDDGRLEYDIEFLAGGKEYEYEIAATTGDILKSSVETSRSSQMDDGKYIGMDAAKAAALAHAGYAAGDVSFTKSKLEYDDGRAEYDIEFVVNNEEHEFEISAETGAVLQYEVERRR